MRKNGIWTVGCFYFPNSQKKKLYLSPGRPNPFIHQQIFNREGIVGYDLFLIQLFIITTFGSAYLQKFQNKIKGYLVRNRASLK